MFLLCTLTKGLFLIHSFIHVFWMLTEAVSFEYLQHMRRAQRLSGRVLDLRLRGH